MKKNIYTSEGIEIRKAWDRLTEEERHNAALVYKSPESKLNEETYTKALKDCMLASGCWPGKPKLLMEEAAQEYEEIFAAQHLMGG